MFMQTIGQPTRRHRTMLAALLVAGIAGTMACGSDESASPSTDSEPSVESDPSMDSSSVPASATEPVVQPTDPSPSTPGTDAGDASGSAVAGLDAAIADLVLRLDLDDDSTIETVVVEEVTWPDRSLGCPQKGMQYAQVLTPGIRIVLAHDGTEYAYHGGDGRAPSYCVSPQPPAPS